MFGYIKLCSDSTEFIIHIFQCSVLSALKVCCSLPSLEHRITLKHLSSETPLTSQVTLLMDGLEKQVAEVTYYKNPTIISTKAVKSAENDATITLKVRLGYRVIYKT